MSLMFSVAAPEGRRPDLDPRFHANNGYKFVIAIIPAHEALAPVA
jgi:hypothetical protein